MTTKLINYRGRTIVLSVSLYFVYSNALHYFSYSSNSYGPDYWPIAPFLLTHVASGMIALLIGPLQFIKVIRQKYTKWHRITGKTYLCCVLVGGSVAIYLEITHTIMTSHDNIGHTGLIGLGSAWLSVSAMAFYAIKKRNFQQHREWIIRSYVATTAFVSFRIFFYLIPALGGWGYEYIGPIILWACWVVPLWITEMILQGSKIQRASMALAKKK